MVMEQASEQSEKQDRDNGKSPDRKPSPDAPFWMLEVHRVVQGESLISAVDVHKLPRMQRSQNAPSARRRAK
jgi:hypothetical protein